MITVLPVLLAGGLPFIGQVFEKIYPRTISLYQYQKQAYHSN